MSTALIGTRKGLFQVDLPDDPARAAVVSEPAFAGVSVTNVVRDRRDGALYVALDHGHFGVHLHRSDDDGRSWTEIAAPTYPEKPADVVDINPMSQREVAWSTQLVWTIEPGHDAEPGVIWCGTIPGGLFRSDDRGESWHLVESLWNHPARAKWAGGGYDDAGIHSIVIDPRGPGRLLVGVSCGGAWRTGDGGASWTVASQGMRADFLPAEQGEDPEAQDPHRIVRCAADADRLYSQHHCGIYTSVNDGDEWVEVPEAGPSTFGFAVAVHPHDPDVAWFVPAVSDMNRVPVDGSLVVTRTRDGGRNFDVLTDGLPQTNAYDLVYRHGLDIAECGERLIIGSTTGNAWWTADGGEHWHPIAGHLPPIAAVRFV